MAAGLGLDEAVNAVDLAGSNPEVYLKAVVGGADVDTAERMAGFARSCGFGDFELTGEAVACFLGTLRKK